MTIREIVNIFGYVILSDIDLNVGKIFYVTDKEGCYLLVVDKILDNNRSICKLYGGNE